MDWAARRRFLILFGLGATGVAFLAIVLIATFYKTPSCSDGVQNQDEFDVDCGGSCVHLCMTQVQPPTVLYTKILETDGRVDLIASVENKNTNAAAKNVSYSITLYDRTQALVKKITGTLDLPTRTTSFVYLPGIAVGDQNVASAFLEIESSSPQWFRVVSDTRTLPIVQNTNRSGTFEAPRIEAVLANPSLSVLTNVQVIAIVRDVRGAIIGASRTVVPTIPGEGQAIAIFTWNSAFITTPASIEIAPIIPLP